MRPFLVCAALACLAVAQGQAPGPSPATLPLSLVQLPDGFSIDIYTPVNVTYARQMALSQGSVPGHPNAVIVYVGSNSDKVTALVDLDGTHTNVTAVTVVENVTDPSGVAWHNGSLYVAEKRVLKRFDNVDSYATAGQLFPTGTNITTVFPNQGHDAHFLQIGPDNRLYVPQGSPSNTGPCSNITDTYADCAINSMALDGSDPEIFASGIRNTVGFDFDSAGHLWATNNGRDNLTASYNNTPDDTLLYIPHDDLDFGFPYCNWQGAGDPEDRQLGSGSIVLDTVNTPPGISNNASFMQYCEDPANDQPPAQALGPHVASLGMRFYKGSMFPQQYNNTIFIAEHGSWDREPAIGYRVMNAAVDTNGTVTSYSIFAQGWLQSNGTVWGRPTDVLPLPDGSMLLSDDANGAIYRISYSASSGATAPVSADSVDA